MTRTERRIEESLLALQDLPRDPVALTDAEAAAVKGGMELIHEAVHQSSGTASGDPECWSIEGWLFSRGTLCFSD